MVFPIAIDRVGLVAFLLLLAQTATASDCIPDPQQWFTESYAPLWAADTGEKLDQVTNHYAETILDHPASGVPVEENSRQWLTGAIRGWQSEGWLGSELDGFSMDRINSSTVVFKTRWHDRYEDNVIAYECGWYQADLIDGQWNFTQYATIDCAAHGLE